MPCIHTHHTKTLIGIYKTDAITLLSHWKFTGSKTDFTQAAVKKLFWFNRKLFKFHSIFYALNSVYI